MTDKTCRHTAAISSPFSPLPSHTMGATDEEQMAAMLCLGRMAALVAGTNNVAAISAVAGVVVNILTEVCSCAWAVPPLWLHSSL